MDSQANRGLRKREVVAHLAPVLQGLGWRTGGADLPVRASAGAEPVGRIRVDAVLAGAGAVMRVTGGRGAQNNELHRALVECSLAGDVRHLVVWVMVRYEHSGGVTWAFETCRSVLHLIDRSGRLRLPFDGVLLLGY